MKKMISVLSVLALLSAASTTAFADSRITPDSADRSSSMNISYTIAPGYIVTIPSGVDLSTVNTAEIKMTGMSGNEKPMLGYNKTVSISLSNAKNGFSGSDGKTLSLKDGNASVSYTLTGVSGKTGKGDLVASFKFDPNKPLDDYKQTLTFAVTSKPQHTGNYSDQLIFDIVYGNFVDISKLTGAYQAQNGDILTGKGNATAHITVADGAAITLKDCDITTITNDESHKWAGITFNGNGTIILAGENKVKGGYEDYPGIFVPKNQTLTIKGGGSLEAGSNGNAAGIGGGNKISCGSINITGGTVKATGGENAAGIGSGNSNSSCGNITINSGNVTATSGGGAAGIGSGNGKSSCGDITITGGTVKASSLKNGVGIGSGNSSFCGNITITGGTVTAIGVINGSGIGCGYRNSCKNISITGGTVKATGGESGAGIGSGYNNSCGNITIKNTVTKVEATKGTNAPNSIGAGINSTCGTVTIENGANVIEK